MGAAMTSKPSLLKFLSLALALFLSASQGHAAEAKLHFVGSSPTAKPRWKSKPYELSNVFYAVGRSARLDSLEGARLLAIKDASAQAAQFLETQGFGEKRTIAPSIENSVLKETELGSVKLGKVKIEGLYQEHWQSTDGKDVWSVRLLLSIRRK
jgi:hypothetical protein